MFNSCDKESWIKTFLMYMNFDIWIWCFHQRLSIIAFF